MSVMPHPTEALSAYVDGDLPDADANAVAAHLAQCHACRQVVDDIARLRDQVRGWATDEARGNTDLWPVVAARISPAIERLQPLPGAHRGHWYQRRISVGLPGLALAATLVAALAATIAYQRVSLHTPQGAAPVVADIESFDVPTTGVATARFADAAYDAAVTDLERVLREQRDHLNPRTVMVIERNLQVIDDAVREARTALASDPANPLLNAQLADVRRRKLQLLRRAAAIVEGV